MTIAQGILEGRSDYWDIYKAWEALNPGLLPESYGVDISVLRCDDDSAIVYSEDENGQVIHKHCENFENDFHNVVFEIEEELVPA